MTFDRGAWVGGLAEWLEDDTAYLSVAFTWKLPEAYEKALWYRSLGFNVRAGGPAVFTQKDYLASVADVGGTIPDALRRHNPMATKASEGCPVGCWFCIVPAMEGKSFTLLPEFEPRPVLTDNNPVMKLNALTKEPWVRHDWTAHKLKQVQRWVNRRIWRKADFADYDASIKTSRGDREERPKA